MKKIFGLILLFAAMMTGVAVPAPTHYIGQFCGPILIVNVEFTFWNDNKYMQKTFYAGQQIGGTEGKYEIVNENLMIMHQVHMYNYGDWVLDRKDYKMQYEAYPDKIYLSPEKADLTMLLPRCK